MKLQASYESACIDAEQQLHREQVEKQERTERITQRIIGEGASNHGSAVAHNFDQMAALYKKIAALVVARCKEPQIGNYAQYGSSQSSSSGIGRNAQNQQDPNYEKEINQILESVFPRVGLTRFMALTAAEKSSQLAELLNICQGIRLLNLKIKQQNQNNNNDTSNTSTSSSSSQTGGNNNKQQNTTTFVEDCWPEQDLLELASNLQKEIDHLTSGCNDFQTVCLKHEKILSNSTNEEDEYSAVNKTSKPKEYSEADRQQIAQQIIYKRQLLCYLLNVQDDFNAIRERLGNYRVAYFEDMNALQEQIGKTKGSLPKEEVYPRFDSLGRLSGVIEADLKLASEKLKLFELLKQHRAQYDPQLVKDVAQRLTKYSNGLKASQAASSDGEQDGENNNAQQQNAAEPVSAEHQQFLAEQQQLQEQRQAAGQPDEGGPTLLTMQSTQDFLSIPLDFQGFCIFSLVELGLLIPGDPAFGVVQYKGRYCVFQSVSGLVNFMKDPGHFFVGLTKACYKNPELIQPLRLHDDFPKSSLYGIIQPGMLYSGTSGAGQLQQQKTVCDDGCQTPDHFVESNIDPNYEWNEWKLRKDALRMADIRKKSTSGTQTISSTFRSEKETQKYLPKDAGTNTGVEKGTSAVRKKRYLSGLRGNTGKTELKVVDFQFDL